MTPLVGYVCLIWDTDAEGLFSEMRVYVEITEFEGLKSKKASWAK